MYGAYVALKKYGVPLDEINSSMPKELQSIRLLADYLSGDSSRKYYLHVNYSSIIDMLSIDMYFAEAN